MASRVRVLNVTHVRPPETSNPLPNNDDQHAIKLSLFDTMFLPFQPMQRLFFYEGDDLPPFPALLATLQSSLAATLAVFTPLAGNLAVSSSPGDVVIDCSPGAVSQGVRFVEAEYAGSADDMRRLASAAEHDAQAYAQLVPTLVVSVLTARALAVQVTRPADDTDDHGGRIGAVVVGVSMCHAVGDGAALWEFIRAWSAAARGGSPVLPGFQPPVFDRAAINRHPKVKEVSRTFQRIFAPALPMVNAFPKPDTTLQGRRTYLVSASQIRSLKQRISLQSSNGSLADGDDKNAPPATVANPQTTTYAAVASLVWTSGVRAKNALSGADVHHTEALMLLGPELNAGRLPAPVLAVQVTRSAIGAAARAGVVVGVSIHHAVADGHSVRLLMRAWSAASRDPASDMVTPPPTWDRTVIPYPKAEEVARKFLRTIAPALPVARSPSLYAPLDQRRRSFLLRADDIRSVKQSILTQSQAIGCGHLCTFPSTYVAVSSLVWTSIVRAKSLHDAAAAGDAYFLVPVDLRRRLDPPLGERYFGNCVAPCFARAAVRHLRDGGAGLGHAAAAIGDAVRARLKDPLGGAEHWLEEFLAVPKERFTHTGSSNRFMAYETDFGWGAPSRVELVSLFTKGVVLLLGAEDGGVQVTVALDHAHMDGSAANFLQVSRRGNRTKIGSDDAVID